uniref:Uncharacterized protein n=1 Tax=Pyxicephalus adspersus TaxID=30357 RepID=A0AAV3B515_PYXAD|nr:TPA: hypothetical protein GDO54_000637 [Pyxicephalus adspersus]
MMYLLHSFSTDVYCVMASNLGTSPDKPYSSIFWAGLSPLVQCAASTGYHCLLYKPLFCPHSSLALPPPCHWLPYPLFPLTPPLIFRPRGTI